MRSTIGSSYLTRSATGSRSTTSSRTINRRRAPFSASTLPTSTLGAAGATGPGRSPARLLSAPLAWPLHLVYLGVREHHDPDSGAARHSRGAIFSGAHTRPGALWLEAQPRHSPR